MASCDEKKALPSAEATVGGIFPDEIAVIKKKAQDDRSAQKITILAGMSVMAFLAMCAILLSTRLWGHDVVTCSLNFWTGKQLLHETVETDKAAETDAFYTDGFGGEAAVMYDHHSMMKAFKLSRSKTCFIFEETRKEKDTVKKAAEELEEKEDGSVEFAHSGGAMMMSVDTERPTRPVLSEKLQDFCGQLEPRWAKLAPATEEEEQKGDRVEIIMPAGPVVDETSPDGQRDKRGVIILIVECGENKYCVIVIIYRTEDETLPTLPTVEKRL